MSMNHRGIPGEIAKELSQLEKTTRDTVVNRRKDSLGKVAIAGGLEIPIEDLVGADLRPEALYPRSDFSEPEKLIANPDPNCKYVWKVFDRKHGLRVDSTRSDALFQGIRSGAYRPVQVDELKEGVDSPFSSVDLFGDTLPGNSDTVVIKGLVLIEVQPGAVRAEYRQRELQAAMYANPALGQNIMRAQLDNIGAHEGLVEVEGKEQ